MTQNEWDKLTTAQRDAQRDLSNLSPQLIGLEGWRVEVVTTYGITHRFNVGRSTGWIPCHLELYNSRSMGGCAADKVYKSVKALRRVC